MEKGIIILNDELHDLWFDWIKDSKPDILGIHPRGGDIAIESLNATIDYINTEEGKKYLKRWRDLGAKIEVESHAAGWMLSQRDFKLHPEWFRTDENGEKNPDCNFCVANEEAMKAISDSAEELCKILPSDTNKYYLWPDDVDSKRCHCAICSEFSESDQMLRFANAVLRGLRRVNPVAKLCYLAYQGTLDVPQNTKPEEGIFLEYAPMKRDFTHAANDPNSAINMEHKEKMEKLLKFFGTEDATVLEYWLDNSMFSNWKKPFGELPYYPELVREDIKFYEAAGFEKITTFAAFLDKDYVERFGIPPVEDFLKAFNG